MPDPYEAERIDQAGTEPSPPAGYYVDDLGEHRWVRLQEGRLEPLNHWAHVPDLDSLAVTYEQRPRPILPQISDAFICTPDCPRCLGSGHVCEDHPDKPWDEGDGCCGAAGMPCDPAYRGDPSTWPPNRG